MGQQARAGGVVRRHLVGETAYLLVSARGKSDEWLIPKGHVEAGETPEQAACREVREEAGIEAVIVRELPQSEFELGGEVVSVHYYLMRYQAIVGAPEDGRRVEWYPLSEALKRLSYPEGRFILQQADSFDLD